MSAIGVAALGCDGPGERPPVSTEAPPAPPGLRLPRDVMPESARVRIEIDPAEESFRGRIEIAARVRQSTRTIWLHAVDLDIESGTLIAGDERRPLEPLPQESDALGLRASEPIPEGPLRIEIDYRGRIDRLESRGVFAQEEDARWYAFTQFEPLAARRAFPWFDEPDRKLPWELTLEVPADVEALANTPVVSEEETERGTRIVRFAQTPPLPSYLVAFAVGPFELVELGRSRTGMPLRAAVPRGTGDQLGYVREVSAELLAHVEDYFDMAYPYAKLDLLAIPLTSYGAMEHPGLITFNARILRARDRDLSSSYRRRYAHVLMHELAHQWFGNWVTLAWWDDLWLNEAFASWLDEKLIAEWRPSWDRGVGPVARRNAAMRSDALASARRIREPITSHHDIESAFDSITYRKGASVIEMFERWLSPEVFREGVRAYVRRHARGNATSENFLQAIGQAAGRDVTEPFASFLEQVGTPLLRVSLRCERPGEPARVQIEQTRYRPLGSSPERAQLWELPVCVSVPAGEGESGGLASACTLLESAQDEFALPGPDCPDWLLPNRGQIGYYRAALGGDGLEALLERGMPALSLPERVGVLHDADALMEAGELSPERGLALAARHAGDASVFVVDAAVRLVRRAESWVSDADRPRFQAFVRALFGARARALGWVPEPGESEERARLRRLLLELVTVTGDDAELSTEARATTEAWLDDAGAVHPEVLGTVLSAAAHHGDAALFERLAEAAERESIRRDRVRLLRTLGAFRGPELVRRALALARRPDWDAREAGGLLYAGTGNPETRRLAYEAIRADYASVVARLPEQSAASLVYTATGSCDPALRDEAVAFFEPRSAELPGGPRVFEQALEQMDLCIAQRAAFSTGVARFLNAWTGQGESAR